MMYCGTDFLPYSRSIEIGGLAGQRGLGGFPMSKALLTLQMPSPPDPVPVVIDPATTALLVFDVIEHICARQPKCREQLVPAVAALLERARQAGGPHRLRGPGRKHVDLVPGGGPAPSGNHN